MTEIAFGCCFCGEDVASAATTLVWRAARARDGQTWWCHEECFFRALHPEFRVRPDDFVDPEGWERVEPEGMGG